jgi:hypothetical protein
MKGIHHYLICFWIIFHSLVSAFENNLKDDRVSNSLDWAFPVSEFLIVVMGVTFLLILMFHKYW